MPIPDARTQGRPVTSNRLLRGALIAAPLSLALWAAIGVTALHALPAHSRHAIAWRLHTVAHHVIGHYREALA